MTKIIIYYKYEMLIDQWHCSAYHKDGLKKKKERTGKYSLENEDFPTFFTNYSQNYIENQK